MIRRFAAAIVTLIFLVIAPGFIAGLVPWWISHWTLEPSFFSLPLVRSIGAVLIGLIQQRLRDIAAYIGRKQGCQL